MHCFILTAMRSGSTYLTNLLWSTGLFHYPDAHAEHPSLEPQRRIREFMAPNIALDPWGTGEKTREQAIAHLRHRLSFMHREPCLFKILMEQYNYYMLGDDDRPLVEEMIPGLKYIWLERKDLIARVVSAYIFFHSHVDHIYDQHSYDDYMSRQVDIDEAGLLDVYENHVKKCNWSPYLRGTTCLRLSYEELVAEPEETLAKCLVYLGLDHSHLDLAALVDAHPKYKTERPENRMWQEKLKGILRRRMIL